MKISISGLTASGWEGEAWGIHCSKLPRIRCHDREDFGVEVRILGHGPFICVESLRSVLGVAPLARLSNISHRISWGWGHIWCDWPFQILKKAIQSKRADRGYCVKRRPCELLWVTFSQWSAITWQQRTTRGDETSRPRKQLFWCLIF